MNLNGISSGDEMMNSAFRGLNRIEYREDDTGWFIHPELSALFEINLIDKHISYLTSVESDYGRDLASFSVGAKIGDVIILMPAYQKKYRLAMYNVKNKELTYVYLREPELRENTQDGYTMFTCAAPSDKCVLLFGGAYPAVIKLNIETGDVVYYTEWYEHLKELDGVHDKYAFFGKTYVEKEGAFYVPMGAKNAVVRVDKNSFDIEILELAVDCDGFFFAADLGESNILLVEYGERAHRVFVWDCYDNNVLDVVEIPVVKAEKVFELLTSVQSAYSNKKMAYLSLVGCNSRVMTLDCKTFECQHMDLKELSGDCTYIDLIGGELLLATDEYKWYGYNIENGSIKECSVGIDDSALINALQHGKCLLVHEADVSLDFFVGQVL